MNIRKALHFIRVYYEDESGKEMIDDNVDQCTRDLSLLTAEDSTTSLSVSL